MDQVEHLRAALFGLGPATDRTGPETYHEFFHRAIAAMHELERLNALVDEIHLQPRPFTLQIHEYLEDARKRRRECMDVMEKVEEAERDSNAVRYLQPEKDDVPQCNAATLQELEENVKLAELEAAVNFKDAGFQDVVPSGDWAEAKAWIVSLVARNWGACERVLAAMPEDITEKWRTDGLERSDVVAALDAGLLKECTDSTATASLDPDVWRALMFLRIAYPDGVQKDDKTHDKINEAREIAAPLVAARVRLEFFRRNLKNASIRA